MRLNVIFQVVVHNPTEFPSVHDNYFRVNMDNDVVVGIKPRVMTTSDALRNYPPERRQCIYPEERHLLYFNMYTQDNCELECFTKYILKQCDCVIFYMPRKYILYILRITFNWKTLQIIYWNCVIK